MCRQERSDPREVAEALFGQWDALHPVFEYTARRFGLPVVEVDTECLGGLFTVRVYLNRKGQHLREAAHYRNLARGRGRRGVKGIRIVMLREASR
jgi:hypothetical protein